MIRLSCVIEQFESEFLSTYQGKVLPGHKKALMALKTCRTRHSPKMLMSCSDCDHQVFVPHSCGHRNCPHCQHHESQQWIERQVQKQLPASYFMITFTLPKELRSLAWSHQRIVYNLMFRCVWETLQTFSLNDKKLRGTPGMGSSGCIPIQGDWIITRISMQYCQQVPSIKTGFGVKRMGNTCLIITHWQKSFAQRCWPVSPKPIFSCPINILKSG